MKYVDYNTIQNFYQWIHISKYFHMVSGFVVLNNIMYDTLLMVKV